MKWKRLSLSFLFRAFGALGVFGFSQHAFIKRRWEMITSSHLMKFNLNVVLLLSQHHELLWKNCKQKAGFFFFFSSQTFLRLIEIRRFEDGTGSGLQPANWPNGVFNVSVSRQKKLNDSWIIHLFAPHDAPPPLLHPVNHQWKFSLKPNIKWCLTLVPTEDINLWNTNL